MYNSKPVKMICFVGFVRITMYYVIVFVFQIEITSVVYVNTCISRLHSYYFLCLLVEKMLSERKKKKRKREKSYFLSVYNTINSDLSDLKTPSWDCRDFFLCLEILVRCLMPAEVPYPCTGP